MLRFENVTFRVFTGRTGASAYRRDVTFMDFTCLV